MSRRIVIALASALLLVPVLSAAELRPDQKAALETALAACPKDYREMMRPQLEATLSLLSPEQVQEFVAALQANAQESSGGTAAEEAPDVHGTASPEDLAYNRAQYEPKVRQFWEVHSAFDAAVDAAMAAHAPGKRYAVSGPGWLYALPAPEASWARAGGDYDVYLEIVEAMVPKDGRYRFDTSGMRPSFDRKAIDAAVAAAWREFDALGPEYVRTIRKFTDADNHTAADAYHREQLAEADRIRQRLNDALAALAPPTQTMLLMPLMSASPAE